MNIKIIVRGGVSPPSDANGVYISLCCVLGVTRCYNALLLVLYISSSKVTGKFGITSLAEQLFCINSDANSPINHAYLRMMPTPVEHHFVFCMVIDIYTCVAII